MSWHAVAPVVGALVALKLVPLLFAAMDFPDRQIQRVASLAVGLLALLAPLTLTHGLVAMANAEAARVQRIITPMVHRLVPTTTSTTTSGTAR